MELAEETLDSLRAHIAESSDWYIQSLTRRYRRLLRRWTAGHPMYETVARILDMLVAEQVTRELQARPR